MATLLEIRSGVHAGRFCALRDGLSGLPRFLKRGRRLLVRSYQRAMRYLHEKSLRRVDSRPIPSGHDEIRLFLVVRNEAHLLPWFLDYYTRLGVDRFFCVDNQSTDGTREILLRHRHVHVFRTDASYKTSKYGVYWRVPLVRAYGRQKWCVFVDADEKLVFPGFERVSLRELCGSLEEEGALGLEASWIQMYAQGPIRLARPEIEQDPVRVCPYFDADSADPSLPHPRRLGWRFHPSKAPLLYRCRRGPFVAGGNHQLKWPPGAPKRTSATRAGVMHFKFTAALFGKCQEELARRQHFASDSKYRGFYQALGADPQLSLMHAASVRFESSEQLIQLGLMRASAPLARRISRRGTGVES